MRTLTKKQWVSWLRWSLLAFIVHAIILGLIYDWNLFSCSPVGITLFGDKMSFNNFYPRVFDAMTIPLFFLVYLFFYNNVNKKDILNTGLLLGIIGVILASLNLNPIVCSISGLLIGIVASVILENYYGVIVEKDKLRSIKGISCGMIVGLGTITSLKSSLVEGLTISLKVAFLFLIIIVLIKIIKRKS